LTTEEERKKKKEIHTLTSQKKNGLQFLVPKGTMGFAEVRHIPASEEKKGELTTNGPKKRKRGGGGGRCGEVRVVRRQRKGEKGEVAYFLQNGRHSNY